MLDLEDLCTKGSWVSTWNPDSICLLSSPECCCPCYLWWLLLTSIYLADICYVLIASAIRESFLLRVCAPSPGRTVPQTRWSKAGQQEMCPLNNSGGGAVLPSTEQTFRRTHCALQEGLMFQVKISPGCPGSSKTFLLTKVDGGENWAYYLLSQVQVYLSPWLFIAVSLVIRAQNSVNLSGSIY